MTGFQEFLLASHILAAVVWVGGSITMLALGAYLRGRDINTRVEYTRWTEWLAPRLFAPASVVVIVAGPMLAADMDLDFSQAWINIGFVGWTISFIFGVGFYPREGKKRERLIEQHGLEHESVAASIGRVLTVAAIDTLIITLVVVDMTVKPFS
jgi:uncharacterized membrane protein